MSLAKTYKQSEAELLSVLISLQRSSGFSRLNYPNLFIYCTKGLRLSEAQACYFSKVVRRADDVPELIEAVQAGVISLSQARRVASVITSESASQWIQKAATLPQRELERAVTVANPKAFVREKIKPIAPERSELRVGISVELERKLQRVREVLSHAKQSNVTLEMALEEMASLFLERKDPVEKAKRVKAKATPPSLGRSIPASVRHEVNRRDLGKCQANFPNQQLCGASLWVEHHHLRPKSLGGPNVAQNLITLCSQHHKLRHGMGVSSGRRL